MAKISNEVRDILRKITTMLDNDERVELTCTDRAGFIDSDRRGRANKKILSQKELVVSSVSWQREFVVLEGVISSIVNVIHFDELKFFKVKEKVFTIKDLADVAVQAYKEGVADEVILGSLITVATRDDYYSLSKDCDDSAKIKSVIDGIESLYDKPFVINDISDLRRVSKGDAGVLLNGEAFEVKDDTDSCIDRDSLFIFVGGENRFVNLSLIKGATITQRRVNE